MDPSKPSPGAGNRPDLPDIDWAGVLAQHERWLRAVIFARVKEAQAVDEIMQEVALSAVRQQAPIHDPTKVAPWLHRLAVRHALMYRRKLGRRRRWLRRYGEESGNGRPLESTPLDWLLRAEREDLVRRALMMLSSRDAEILLLKYGENWSYQQIADHLGISFSAAQTRLHRARQRLRNELAQLSASIVEKTGKESPLEL